MREGDLHDGGRDGSSTVTTDAVDGPGHDGGDVGLATDDGEEGTEVSDAVTLAVPDDQRSSGGDEGAEDDEGTTHADLVGDDGDDHAADDGGDVWRCGEQLRVPDRETESSEDEGEEVGEGVGGKGGAHE